jgi:hypothetical protein
LNFRAAGTHRFMKFKRQGGTAMALGIFIGGIFLGFSLGFATMALVAARGVRLQGQEAIGMEDYPACAYTPIRTVSPAFRSRPQVSEILLTPWP